jgi:hypothetical protein
MARAMGRVRWTRAQAAARLESWRASGLSLAKFATRERVGYERLRRWRTKLAHEAGPRFAAVEIEPSRAAASDAITIELRCGIRLMTSERVSAEIVSRLARALEQIAC